MIRSFCITLIHCLISLFIQQYHLSAQTVQNRHSIYTTVSDIERGITSGELANHPIDRASGLDRGDRDAYYPGKIPFTEEVSQSGAKVYNVPVMTAAGWHFKPSVSLLYNSQSGNGIAGYGWTISGIPAITIRNRGVYYDGNCSASLYDQSNAYYSLDGVPIVNSSFNIGDYSYATVRGDVQIRKYNLSGGGAAYFKALYPDGSVATFGFTDQTYPEAIYPITHLRDVEGNEISFSYTYNGGAYYIGSIAYGDDASLVFNYTSRQDQCACCFYYAGMYTTYPARLLSSIESRDGESVICRYTLTHTFADNVSLLKAVSCSSGDSSLPPLTFSYGIEDDEIQSNASSTFSLAEEEFFSTYFPKTGPGSLIYRRGRFVPGSQGDDMIVYPNFSNHAAVDSTWSWGTYYYKYESLYSAEQEILCNLTGHYSSIQRTLTAGAGFQLIEAVDINGDGVDELVKVNNSPSVISGTVYTITIYTFDSSYNYTSSSFQILVNDSASNQYYNNPPKSWYRFGDFRGTGKMMLLIMTGTASHFVLVDLMSQIKINEQNLYNLDAWQNELTLATDLDGDGRTELCHVVENAVDVYHVASAESNSFTLKASYGGTGTSQICVDLDYIVNNHYHPALCQLQAVDVNGDGYQDIVSHPLPATVGGAIHPDYIFVSWFNGKSFSTLSQRLFLRTTLNPVIFLDIDKDGLPDLLHVKDSSLYVVGNQGGCFFGQESYATIELSPQADLIPGDASIFGANGEVMVYSGQFVRLYKYGVDHSFNRSLVRFEDSFGNIIFNDYKDIFGYSGAYLVDTQRSYNDSLGFGRSRIPLKVFRGASAYSGDQCYKDEYLLYFDAVSNNRGLGFCGFGKILAMNNITGDYITNTLDPEKFGVLTNIEVAKGQTVSPYYVQENTYDNNSTQYGKLDPRLIRTETVDSLTRIVTSTDYTYDNYGYPSDIQTSRRIGIKVPKTERVLRTYQHSLSPYKYILGTITEESVISEGDINSSISWAEKTTTSIDSYFRPINQKKYVGRHGHTGLIPFPGNDSLILRGPPDSLRAIPHNDEWYAATNLLWEKQWAYDSHGNVSYDQTAHYGASEFLTSLYLYDNKGRYLQQETDECGRNTFYAAYDKKGHPHIVTDFLGNVDTLIYDGWGNLIRKRYADGTIETQSVSWGGPGLYRISQTCDGRPSRITDYDALGREVCTEELRFDGQWKKKDTRYNVRGDVSMESLPYLGVVPSYWNTYAYDGYGRLSTFAEASGKLTTWSYNGTVVTKMQDGMISSQTMDANGNLISVNDPGGGFSYVLRDDEKPSRIAFSWEGRSEVSFSYDDYGRRTMVSDPSAGQRTTTYTNNLNGSSSTSVQSQTGTVTTNYDKFGRVTLVERSVGGNTSRTYDSYGRLVGETSTNGSSLSCSYDSLGRLKTRRMDAPGGRWLKQEYRYGLGGNLAEVEFTTQNGQITKEIYSYSNGYNTSIRLSDSTLVWKLEEEDSLGLPVRVSTGGLSRTYRYTPFGLPSSRKIQGGSTIQNFTYNYSHVTGNLMSRTDSLRGITETFAYDSLSRLTSMGNRGINYAPNGNLLSMDGVGQMSYGDYSHPFRITRLMPSSSDNIPAGNVSIGYTSAGRPLVICNNTTGLTASLIYDGGEDRVRMNLFGSGGNPVSARYYLGDRYECDSLSTGIRERLYLGGDAYSAPRVYQRENNGNWAVYDIGRDHLGSVTHVVDSGGNIVAEYSYDPWGRLRNPQTHQIYSPGNEPDLFLGRGFTGHEHLSAFGLINMNARLYDPLVGRFFSPDPYVQDPLFTQNFNRYSYALNNPLRYTDKNGEFVLTTTAIVSICVGAAIGAGFGIWQGVSTANDHGLVGSDRAWTIAGAGIFGAFSGALGGYVGVAVSAALPFSGFAAGAISGAASGAVSGGINGLGNALIERKDLGAIARQTLIEAAVGAGTGALVGGILQGLSSYSEGEDFWNGKVNSHRKGNIGEARAEKMIRSRWHGELIGNQTLFDVDGTKVRFDYVAKIGDDHVFVEVKNGPYAGYTTNQRIVYPKFGLPLSEYYGDVPIREFLSMQPIIKPSVSLTPIGKHAMDAWEKVTSKEFKFIVIKF